MRAEKAALKGRKGAKIDKVRETTLRAVCAILSKGARTYSFNDEATAYSRSR